MWDSAATRSAPSSGSKLPRNMASDERRPEEFALEGDDRKDVFFYEADDARFVPRALLLDLEPRVVNNIQNSQHRDLFNPRTYLSRRKAAARATTGRRATGRRRKTRNYLADMLDREADNSDSLEGFVLTHSIAGGTGSGMGSYILEHLNDHFPKKFVSTYSTVSRTGRRTRVMW